jgi:hypothetical protein
VSVIQKRKKKKKQKQKMDVVALPVEADAGLSDKSRSVDSRRITDDYGEETECSELTTYDMSDDEVEWENMDDGGSGGSLSPREARGSRLARAHAGSARALIKHSESSDCLSASSSTDSDASVLQRESGDESNGDDKTLKKKSKKEKKEKKEKKKSKTRSMTLTPKLTKRTTMGLGEMAEQRRSRKPSSGSVINSPAASPPTPTPQTSTPDAESEQEGEVYQFGRTYLFAFMPNGYAARSH